MLQEKLDGGLRAATAGRPAPALHESIPEFVAMDGAEQGGLEEGELEEGWEIHDFIRRAKVVEESQHAKQVLREALRGVAVLLRDRPTTVGARWGGMEEGGTAERTVLAEAALSVQKLCMVWGGVERVDAACPAEALGGGGEACGEAVWGGSGGWSCVYGAEWSY